MCGRYTRYLPWSEIHRLYRLTVPADVGMADYISRECRRRLGKCPPFGFAFDVSDAGRLHLHGVVVPFIMEEKHLDQLDEALMAAGGRLKGARTVQLTQNYISCVTTALDGLPTLLRAWRRLSSSSALTRSRSSRTRSGASVLVWRRT